MLAIESLRDYINILNKEDFNTLANNIYKITESSDEDYPNRKNWYFTKQLPNIESGERNILFVRDMWDRDKIVAVSCLKDSDNEKKICTLYVAEEYRNVGLGNMLFQESMLWLGTSKPFLTFPEYKLNMFESFIEKYNWQLEDKIEGKYNNSSPELCYNGSLNKKLIKKAK